MDFMVSMCVFFSVFIVSNVLLEPVVPMTACSQNIAQIFGTNTTAFELLVLKRKIMGPCWIQIRHPEVDNKGVAGCRLYPLPFVYSPPVHFHRFLGVTLKLR